MARILVVDDNAFMRLMLKNMLTGAGHEVVGEAENGIEAVEQFKALGPDLVTLDITMPEADGIEALHNIRAADGSARVIMVSALGQEQKVIESVKGGAKDFVVKPFNEERVLQALGKALA